MSSMEGKLHIGWTFFKFMIPGFETKLNLPLVICDKLESGNSLHAILISAKGRWDVMIRHDEKGQLYFERGWDVFVQNHGLKVDESAVFEYLGDSCFNVSLKDKNGDEKGDTDELEQQCSISSSEETENEHYFYMVEKDEETITSAINSCLAPLIDLLAEIENTPLPCHDKDKRVDTEHEMNVEGESSSSVPPSAESGPENVLPPQTETQERVNEDSRKFRFLSKLLPRSPENGNLSLKRRRVDDETVALPVKIQKQNMSIHSVKLELEADDDNDMNENSVEQENHEYRVPTRARTPRRNQEKSSVNDDKNKNSVEQENHEDRVPTRARTPRRNQEKSSLNNDKNKNIEKQENHDDQVPIQARTQKRDQDKSLVNNDKNEKIVKQENHDDQAPSSPKRIKRELRAKTSSSEQTQFSTLIKPYHVRSRSPYMLMPAAFCVANKLYQNGRVTLKVPSGERKVSLKVCKGGKTIYATLTRGWPEFIAGNDLKEGDQCIFKLLRRGRSSDDIVLDVDIIRAAT